MNSLRVKENESIADFGVGAVGLAAVMAARVLGANPVIAADVRPKRLALARELGATHTIDSRKQDVAVEIGKIAGGIGHVVEGTGDPTLPRIGRALLDPGGRMAMLTGGTSLELPGGRRIFSVIQGDAVPQRFIQHLIELWQSGVFPFDRLIRFYKFADINRAIADANSGRTVKPVLRIGEAA